MIERVNGPTPRGGDYSVATYLRGFVEVDRQDADTVVIAEYTTDGRWLGETVGRWTPPPRNDRPAPAAGVAGRMAALGIDHDDSRDSTVTFVGPRGVAAQQPQK